MYVDGSLFYQTDYIKTKHTVRLTLNTFLPC